MDNLSNQILLSRKEAAKALGVKEQTLAAWSCTKRYNLKNIKVGRLVKYRLSDIQDVLANGVIKENLNNDVNSDTGDKQ